MDKDFLYNNNIAKPLVTAGVKAVEAVTQKGKELVQDINPHSQQEEVVSQETSQGIASNILGSILHQQAQSRKTQVKFLTLWKKKKGKLAQSK